MFWLRVAQWVLFAHLVLIMTLAMGGVIGLVLYGVMMVCARAFP